jgi:D-ribose pyranase
MQEIGILNRLLSKAIAEQGHGDMLMVVDAGFAIPKELEVIDLSLSENRPLVPEVLAELKKYYSVEGMIIARQTKEHNPKIFNQIATMWGNDVPVQLIDHPDLKRKSHEVKVVIRTGDFHSFNNVILISGCGGRWINEK